MKQVYISKNTRKNTQQSRPLSKLPTNIKRLWREGPGIYEVQSFNPKKKQLWYRVVLKPFDNECRCACEYFKYNPGLVYKHILKIVEVENGCKV
jgi:hypothetical protein